MRIHLPFVLSGAAALCLGLLFYTGLYCSDDTRYFIGADKLAQGLPVSAASNAEQRLLFLLPAALNLFLFEDISVLVGSFLAYYIGLVLVTYAGGCLLGASLARVQERPWDAQWQEAPAVGVTLRLLPYGVLGLMALQGVGGNLKWQGGTGRAAPREADRR